MKVAAMRVMLLVLVVCSPWMVRTSFTGSMGKLMVVKCKARSSFLLETTNTRWVC